MKYLKWVLLAAFLALGGWFLYLKFGGGGTEKKTPNPTASTGTFSGFDNFFSGLLNKPNYNPGGTAVNNIQGILNGSQGLINSIGKLFSVTNPTPAVSAPLMPSTVAPDNAAAALDWSSWDTLSTTPDWSNPTDVNYNDPGNGAG